MLTATKCLMSLLLLLGIAASCAWGQGIQYTLNQTEDMLSRLLAGPYVQPTASALAYDAGGDGLADVGLDSLVIGRTPGTAGGGYTWTSGDGTVMNVPSLNLYGCRLTDPLSTATKTKVVLTGGNHANESHSLYVLEGMMNLLSGANPVADYLRTYADIYIYPQVNPEGRWAPGAGKTSSLGQQPSHPNLDHNRYWNDPETPTGIYNLPWAETVIVRDALLNDTGAENVEYIIDFHSPDETESGKSYIYTTTQDAASDFAQAAVGTGGFTVSISSGEPGMMRIWGCSSDGLNATYGFTPEIRRQPNDSPDEYMQLGENLTFALYTAMTNEIPDPNAPSTIRPGETLLLDFNATRANPAGQWNVQDAPGKMMYLVSDAGRATSACVSIAGGLQDSTVDTPDQWNTANDGPDWLDAGKEAAQDYFWQPGGTVGTVTLSGLIPGEEYRLELLASSCSTNNGDAIYTLNDICFDGSLDGMFNFNADGYVDGQWLTWSSVLADADGELVLRIDTSFAPSESRARVNALSLTAVPEPTTAALLTLGSLLIISHRRHRSAVGL